MDAVTHEGVAKVKEVNVLLEAVFTDEDSEYASGYNVYNVDTDETIGFISRNEDWQWHCDKDTRMKFDEEEFDSALNYCVAIYENSKTKTL